MEPPFLSLEQQLTLRIHRDELLQATMNAIALAQAERRFCTVEDFMPQIELTVKLLGQAMQLENFAKEQVKQKWGL